MVFFGTSQWEAYNTDERNYGPSATTLGLSGAEYPMAQACAAGLVAQKCVEKAGTVNDAELMRAAADLDFTTFYGRFKLDPITGCQVGHTMVVVQWREGCKRVVWPPSGPPQ